MFRFHTPDTVAPAPMNWLSNSQAPLPLPACMAKTRSSVTSFAALVLVTLQVPWRVSVLLNTIVKPLALAEVALPADEVNFDSKPQLPRPSPAKALLKPLVLPDLPCCGLTPLAYRNASAALPPRVRSDTAAEPIRPACAPGERKRVESTAAAMPPRIALPIKRSCSKEGWSFDSTAGFGLAPSMVCIVHGKLKTRNKNFPIETIGIVDG